MAALIAFAANSILCRKALGGAAIDAASFTAVRLASGAATLALLARLARPATRADSSGSWLSGLALFVYAAAFSFAYLRLQTGMGALLLFAAVQGTMIGWGLKGGERLRASEWLGFTLAAAGFVALTLPGTNAPDLTGAVLMTAAGLSWGVYSLRGRGEAHALAATAANFARSLPLAGLLALAGVPQLHAAGRGILLAALSGSVASGIGYSLWYGALKGLSATRASVVQLAVPVLAAAGGVVFLGERLTPRLALGGAVVLIGIALANVGGKLRR